ncbi:uncharacterized protein I303_107537 [Kwoniella dejecticola CBS 10117]|uniref:Cystathionine gamma-synthase n=1 Tax=Kwoniella dejecticola CBS 10117 TaxID=1296121 RepID=A0AAJ8KWA0_9TREE
MHTSSSCPLQDVSSDAPTDLATIGVHGDDSLNAVSSAHRQVQDIAPALHVSTTYRYSNNPEELLEANDLDLENHEGYIYSREFAPNTKRAEAILSKIIGGKALCYSSGLGSLFAAYPKRVSIGLGYHGSKAVLDIHTRLTGLQCLPLDCDVNDLHPGDIIHLETPFNPTGEVRDIAYYADKAHSRGAFLLVDSTLAPPPLQDPFALGADVVMHSGTKYFGGHSDLLSGVLAVRNDEWFSGLWNDRITLGSVMGNMEAWLTIRSLRTLELRVTKQSDNARQIVDWLNDRPSKVISRVSHAVYQWKEEQQDWIGKQMPNGFGAVFAVNFSSPDIARKFPSYLQIFNHATSIGGLESLVEWRAISDATVDKRLVRFSIGVESAKDLIADLEQALVRLEAA